jgi:glycosyltransferase involved in cell wall biosynthesis
MIKAANSPKLSVALCSYNGERYIEEQLASIAMQTVSRDIELVVCDDRSTDQTVAIVSRFASTSGFPVRIFRNEQQLGVLENFVRAFERCQAPLIAYCDQDDVWQPEKLERCAAIFDRQSDVALVSHSSEITDEKLRSSGLALPRRIRSVTWSGQHLPLNYWGFGHQMVFSARVVPLIRYLVDRAPPGLAVYHKNLDRLIPLASGVFGGVSFINRPLTKFRRHASSVSPAAKGDAPGVKQMTRWDQNLHSLSVFRDAIEGMQNLLGGGSSHADVPVPSGLAASYLSRLLELQAKVDRRLRVYGASSRGQGAIHLWKAVAAGAYGRESRLGFGSRQFLIDGYLIGTRSEWPAEV